MKVRRQLPCASVVAGYVGCIAGAILIADYQQQLIKAGFSAVEVIDTGADLNAYAKVENQSACYSPAMSSNGGLPIGSEAGCCTPNAPSDGQSLHSRLAEILSQYNVNDFAASVRVFAVKPDRSGDNLSRA